ncbi:MAG: AroM family protein [Candidatus Bathyarchaeia archaeon]
MTHLVALVTVGQAPRDDVVPGMREILGPEVQIMERGALDGLTLRQVLSLTVEPGDFPQETMLRDGTVVAPGMRHVVPRVKKSIDTVAREGAEIIVILCTSEWPNFASEKPIIYPWKVLQHLIRGLMVNGKIGVISPVKSDTQSSDSVKWTQAGFDVAIETASPYSKGWREEIRGAAERLSTRHVDIVVLDCIGYNNEMKGVVKDLIGRPVILPCSIIARVVKELL